MTPERIYAITVPLAVAAAFCAMVLGLDRCSTRNQELRSMCIQQGGTLIESGDRAHCIAGQKTVTKL